MIVCKESATHPSNWTVLWCSTNALLYLPHALIQLVGFELPRRTGTTLSKFLVVGVPLAVEVFKVFSQNRVCLSLLSSKSLTFQFLVVVVPLAMEVFKVSQPQKSAKADGQVGIGVVVDSSSSTPGAYGQAALADDDDGVEGFYEDDGVNVWIGTSKNTWVDPHGESWLHVRRRGAVYGWNLDTQHIQRHPPWER